MISIYFIGYAQRIPAMLSIERINASLFLACEKGPSLKTIAWLIDHGANVNAENEAKNKPLHIACTYGHIDIVKFLVENGADINFRLRGFTTPLHCAVLAQHVHIVRYLLDRGVDIDVLNRKGLTAFDLALRYRDKAIIELFPGQSSEESELCDELYHDSAVNVTC